MKTSPLFCPKCRQKILLNVKQLNISVIQKPDAEPITNEEDVIENDAIGWAQPSPEDYMIEWAEQIAHERLLLHMQESFIHSNPQPGTPPTHPIFAGHENQRDSRCRGCLVLVYKEGHEKSNNL